MAETFVLIHGAWHGAWCWTSVMRQLELGGHRAFAVDLPGRWSNPCDPAKVTLSMYVDSVTSFIEERDLRNVVLAGHSLAGITMPGVACRIPRRIKRVVFVTALVIPDGAATADEIAQYMSPEAVASMRGVADGQPSFTLAGDRLRKAFIQDGSRDLQEFVAAAMVPEPSAPMKEPVPMSEFYRLNIPTAYLACEDDIVFDDPRVWSPGFSSRLHNPIVRSIKSGHEVMFTKPAECARELAALDS